MDEESSGIKWFDCFGSNDDELREVDLSATATSYDKINLKWEDKCSASSSLEDYVIKIYKSTESSSSDKSKCEC